MAVWSPRKSRQILRSRRGNEAELRRTSPPALRVAPFAAILAALFFSAAPGARAQRSSNWRVYKVADGLAETSCRSVTISAQGRVLVTHPSAPLITILDGFAITNIPSPGPRTGPVYESPAGQLWSPSAAGLHEFRDGEWVLHPGLISQSASTSSTPTSDVSNAILCPVRQGQLLVLVPDRLFVFNAEPADRKRLDVLRGSAQAGIGPFLGMTPSRDGGLWISGATGLAKVPGPLRSLTKDSEWKAFFPPPELAARNFREPHEDAAGAVTVLAEDSNNKDQAIIVVLDGQGWATVRNLPEKPKHAWRGPDDSLWAITSGSLLQGSVHPPRVVENNEIPARSFLDVALEPSGAFWLATSDGLFRYAPLCWQTPSAAAGISAPVRCIAVDKEDIWFVAGNTLNSIRQNHHQEYKLPTPVSRALQNATTIFPLNDGTLVLDAEDLLQLDPGSGKAKLLCDPANKEHLRALGFLKEGVLVVHSSTTAPDAVPPTDATPGAPASRRLPTQHSDWTLKTFDGRNFGSLPFSPPPDPIGRTVSRLFAAENGDLWLSSESGTALLHDRKWRAFPAGDKTAPASAIAFAAGTDGRIWCASRDQIWEFDGKDWSNARGGFDRINALLAARDGSIWVGSDAGLFRLFHGVWVENGVEEGLPAASVRAICQDKNERLWVATSAGLSTYNPKADLDAPATTIYPVGDKERNIPEGGAISVSFTATDKWKFTPRSRLLYSRRVDGGEWSSFQDSTAITLTDLAAGKHEFQVRAMDRNGNIDPRPATLEFAVVLPWYRERRLVLISSAGAAAVLFFAALAFNRHRRLVRSYARVEGEIAARTRELEIANRELLQSQKMNALGTLAAGIAHDFNNILSIVKGSAQIIEENLDNAAKVRTRVDRIKTVVEQGSGIVKAMLGFSRDTDQQTGPCDLNATIDDTIKLLGDRFLREVEVRFERASALPPATCSKDFVQQILLNFIFNAADAMAKSSDTAVVQASTSETPSLPGCRTSAPAGQPQVLVHTQALTKLPPNLVLTPTSAATFAAISVQDHGCGIPPENLPRIFEPFFTTKAMSTKRGTGLGLSMAYELAKKMGAGLAVQSILNEGSTFTLILPVSSEPTTSLNWPSPSPSNLAPERPQVGSELRAGPPPSPLLEERVGGRRQF